MTVEERREGGQSRVEGEKEQRRERERERER